MIARATLTKEQFNITSERMWLFALLMYTNGSDSFGNATESARQAGYTGNDNTLSQTGLKLVRNGKVQSAKPAIMLDNAEKLDHNRDIAVDLLRCDLACLESKAMTGDTVAINARTGIVRELNAISNLHSSTISTDQGLTINIGSQRKQVVSTPQEAIGAPSAPERALLGDNSDKQENSHEM